MKNNNFVTASGLPLVTGQLHGKLLFLFIVE